MNFEPGEIVELENGDYAEVIWDNGHEVDLKVISTGDHARRTVQELLEIDAR